jgi:hypothetical protein
MGDNQLIHPSAASMSACATPPAPGEGEVASVRAHRREQDPVSDACHYAVQRGVHADEVSASERLLPRDCAARRRERRGGGVAGRHEGRPSEKEDDAERETDQELGRTDDRQRDERRQRVQDDGEREQQIRQRTGPADRRRRATDQRLEDVGREHQEQISGQCDPDRPCEEDSEMRRGQRGGRAAQERREPDR